MKGLLKKELISLFCSLAGISFSIAYLLICGLFLWFFAGALNIPDAGYTTLVTFFELSPILFLFLIPALTMRSFAEEKKNKTFTLLLSRPQSVSCIIWSKLLPMAILVLLNVVIAVSVYVFSVRALSLQPDSLDLYVTVFSAICLFALTLVFIAIGLFASSITDNQIVALIFSILINIFVFFGFDLLGGLFSDGKSQMLIASIGLNSHYQSMSKGVLYAKDVLVFFNYIILFFFCTWYAIGFKIKGNKIKLFLVFIALLAINIISTLTNDMRFDFTADNRYTLSKYTENKLIQLADNKQQIDVNVYLEGTMNASFQRLKNGIKDILTDFGRLSEGKVRYTFIDPYQIGNSPKEVHECMADKGMDGIILNETDREGKVSQQVIYPYAQVIAGSDTLTLNLLKRVTGKSAEENLSASIDNLEFELTDAIRLLQKGDSPDIAFIEGHGELAEPYVEDATMALAKYFNVHRGQIAPDVFALSKFRALVIAGAYEKYTEQEKFVLDQYIMNGGRVLWLLDGVFFPKQEISDKGETTAIKNETNLDDLLFTYGVRINPVLLQDAQCSSIMLSSGGENAQPSVMPFYYSPLLMPSPNHVITKDVSDIKAAFVSSVDVVGKQEDVKKSVLLTTSANAHTVQVPSTISFGVSDIQNQKNYFNEPFLATAISLEGAFRSAFANRMIPDSVYMNNYIPKTKGQSSKMIVVASSDIIRNEIVGHDSLTQVLPIGFERATGKLYGNREFVVNAMMWLTYDNEWMSLRNKQQGLILLNKKVVYENRNFYAAINTLLPILIVALLFACVFFYRKWKYEK